MFEFKGLKIKFIGNADVSKCVWKGATQGKRVQVTNPFHKVSIVFNYYGAERAELTEQGAFNAFIDDIFYCLEVVAVGAEKNKQIDEMCRSLGYSYEYTGDEDYKQVAKVLRCLKTQRDRGMRLYGYNERAMLEMCYAWDKYAQENNLR